MKLKFLSKFFSIFGLFFSVCSSTFASTELGLMAGLNLGSNTYSVNTTSISSGSISAVAFGATFYQGFNEKLGISVDALFQKRGSSLNATTGFFNVSTDITMSYLVLPVMLRVDIVPQYFRLGVGGYLGLAMSDVTISSAGTTVSASRSAAGLSSTDFGLVASARGAMPINPNLDLIGDVRYLLGLSDVDSTAAVDSKLRDLSILAGVSYKF